GAVWASPTTTLHAGDTLGVTYSDTNRVARFYVNGTLVVTITLPPNPGAIRPIISPQYSTLVGSFRATPSAYSGAYAIDLPTGGNVAPAAVADAVATFTGTPISFDPRVNDVDANLDSLTISALGAQAPQHGTVVI